MLLSRVRQKKTADPVSSGPAYLPGIDGLRAIAVLAVLLFHGGVARFGGGFLGVEVFFVVSGYLITLLLFREHLATGEIQLAAFWGRRARRLLPAAATLVGLALVYALLFLPDEVAGLREDALSAAGYVTNWWLVYGDKPYFETIGRPSAPAAPLVSCRRGTVLPGLANRLCRLAPVHRPLGRVHRALVGATGSYALMAALHSPLIDPSRVYYGTDTRAGGLLLGAALALVWDPRKARRCVYRNMRALSACSPLPRLSIVVWAFLALDSSSSWLYPWGFIVIGLGTSATIVAATHPSTSGSSEYSEARRCAGRGPVPTGSTSGTGRSSCSHALASTLLSMAPTCFSAASRLRRLRPNSRIRTDRATFRTGALPRRTRVPRSNRLPSVPGLSPHRLDWRRSPSWSFRRPRECAESPGVPGGEVGACGGARGSVPTTLATATPPAVATATASRSCNRYGNGNCHPHSDGSRQRHAYRERADGGGHPHGSANAGTAATDGAACASAPTAATAFECANPGYRRLSPHRRCPVPWGGGHRRS